MTLPLGLTPPLEGSVMDFNSECINSDETSTNPSISDMNEVKIQTNGACTHVEENDNDLNSSKNDKLPTSVDKLVDDPGCSHDSNYLSSTEHVDADLLPNYSNATQIEKPRLLDSSAPTVTNSSPSIPMKTSSQTSSKGYGLKKWRRIRRDIPKDASVNLDSSKILKRGSANFLDGKQPSDGSVSSTNALVTNLAGADDCAIHKLGSNYNLPVDTTFNAGADSDNSEDRSSKSSTAASAFKYRYDAPKASGHQREKHRAKSVSGRNLSSVGQRNLSNVGHRFQLGKGQLDTSKKPRGESINLDKENSLSSMESDSRSCNSVFIRGTSSVNSYQIQSEMPINYDEEDACGEPACEEQSAEAPQNVSLTKENSVEFPPNAKEGKSDNHQLPRNCDPLINSIRMLQVAQDALEREVQSFGRIGKGICSLWDDSGETAGVSISSLSVGSDICMDHASDGHACLNKNGQSLERQLNEAERTLKEKELRIVELETKMKSMDSPPGDQKSALELQHEMEAELEDLFKSKVEAEVQCAAMTRSTRELTVLVEDQIKLLREQKYVAKEQEQSLRTIANLENKAVMLKSRVEELEMVYRDTGDDEILKMRRRVGKFSTCLFIQLIFLVLVLRLLALQLLPKSAVVVPT